MIRQGRGPQPLQERRWRRIGLEVPGPSIAYTLDRARLEARSLRIGCRPSSAPSFTMGGTGGGIAYNPEEFERICRRAGSQLSLNSEILVESPSSGWKEFELEVMRDRKDNVVIVCSIENLDPMGVHTGDSITVAPQQTLTDREYQEMRDASIASCARSAWRPAAATSSSRHRPRDRRSSSSR